MVYTHTDEHAAVLLHASQHSHITHTGNNGAGDHQSVGGVDGPEGSDEGSELGVYHLKYPERHHKRTTQLQESQNRQNIIIMGLSVQHEL